MILHSSTNKLLLQVSWFAYHVCELKAAFLIREYNVISFTAGEECADALRKVTANIEKNMPDVKSKFTASFLEDNDFYLLVADAAAEAVQYGT